MMVSIMKKYIPIALLLLLILGIAPHSTVSADGNNLFLSDCLDDKKDCEDDAEIESEDTVEAPTSDSTSKPSTLGSSVGDYIKTLFALVFVIGLLYALLKFINRRNRLYDKTRLMKNMGGISLGQHKSIQLVVIGETYYLIGVGDDIRLLKEVTDADEIEKLTEFYQDDAAPLASGILEKVLNKLSGKKNQEKEESRDEPTEFSTIFNTRIDEMKEERKRQLSRLTEKGRKRDE
ncbi:flagellar biosynthetic protein FliO [Sporosarcina siberiensis]|uniref:Flagellar biosynthetic protein FliO n=1 Tax=Sporosarcina siberiensis TaxID=1365606 RepID=A0ABW4SJ43_9BACL